MIPIQTPAECAEIIGGVFPLPESGRSYADRPTFLRGNPLLLANARSGLTLVAEILQPSCIWLPSYLCDSLLAAARAARARWAFYPMDATLRVQSTDWIDSLSSGDLVVLIDYFGFAADDSAISAIQDAGCWIFQDASQALLLEPNPASDFVLRSPTKFLGVPDGGILASMKEVSISWPPLNPPPDAWWRDALGSRVLRRDFDRSGGSDRTWFDLFRKASDHAPIGAFSMSRLAEKLLHESFDYSEIAAKRRCNYRTLLSLLGHWALFPELPESIVPLGFPVRLRERDSVREQLFRQSIYPPVHWHIDKHVPMTFDASHLLSRQIMTLPCDQRYSDADMQRLASAFTGAVGTLAPDF